MQRIVTYAHGARPLGNPLRGQRPAETFYDRPVTTLRSETEFAVPATELDVTEWMGKPTPLAELRGRVVLIEAFQMLCPGCVSNGLPQVQRVRRTLPEVAVLGLHCVFEHHDAQGPNALRAFMAEYRIGFPVGVDRHDRDTIPVTMRAYGLEGTPSTLLIDRAGRLRLTKFGTITDMALGAELGLLLSEKPAQVATATAGA